MVHSIRIPWVRNSSEISLCLGWGEWLSHTGAGGRGLKGLRPCARGGLCDHQMSRGHRFQRDPAVHLGCLGPGWGRTNKYGEVVGRAVLWGDHMGYYQTWNWRSSFGIEGEQKVWDRMGWNGANDGILFSDTLGWFGGWGVVEIEHQSPICADM